MTIVEYRGPTSPGEIRKYLMRRPKAEIVDEYIRIWREFGTLDRERDAAVDQVAYWRERALEAEGERDALAAHVGTCHEVMRMVDEGPEYITARVEQGIRLARERKPETDLARQKLLWQAEALKEAKQRMQGTCYGDLRLDEYIDELSRQADETKP